MSTQNSHTVTRAQASTRLIEAAHQMFAQKVDDLALLAVVGSVLTGAFEELDIQAVNTGDAHPLKGFFDKDKRWFSLWFNFLKHGERSPRSPGSEFDFSFLGEQADRDIHLFGLIWNAAIYHVSAYECSTELIDTILFFGNVLWGHEDDEIEDSEHHAFICQNLRWLAGEWYVREERAQENKVDLQEADKEFKALYANPITDLLGSCPKLPVRNKRSRRG